MNWLGLEIPLSAIAAAVAAIVFGENLTKILEAPPPDHWAYGPAQKVARGKSLGCYFRLLASTVLSREAYVNVLEPTLRDMYDEYREALNQGHHWKARWVVVRGYWSFWSALGAQLPRSIMSRIYALWKAIL